MPNSVYLVNCIKTTVAFVFHHNLLTILLKLTFKLKQTNTLALKPFLFHLCAPIVSLTEKLEFFIELSSLYNLRLQRTSSLYVYKEIRL